MRQILYLLFTIVVFSSCGKNNFVVEGRVLTEVEGEMIYLKVSGEDKNIKIDSTVVTNGRFKFEGHIDSPVIGYIHCSNMQMDYPLVIEPGVIEVNIINDVKISGTVNNEIFNTYKCKSQSTMSLLMQIKNQEKDNLLSNNDTELHSSLKTVFDSVNTSYLNFTTEFIKSNSFSILGAYVLYKNMTHYNDTELIELYDSSSDIFRQSIEGRKIGRFISGIKNTSIGNYYTDVALEDLEGRVVNLSDYVGNGEFILLNFWATWCEPCRREIPLVNHIYDTYAGKGIKIVSISLDNDQLDLKRYVKNTGLRWDVLTDYKGWQSKAALTYSINKIPASVLINKKGVIVAKNVPLHILSESLEDLISE